MNKLALSLLSLSLIAGCGGEMPIEESSQAVNIGEILPTGKGAGVFNGIAGPRGDNGVGNDAKPNGGAITQAGINYHGGAVMLGTVTAYIIWYGNWTGNTATTLLPSFLSNIGGSPYYNINTSYTNGAGTKLSNSIAYGGSYQYTGTSGYSTSLSDANIQTVVANTINGGFLPKSTNAIYFVLTSQDVTASSGFCTQYCGWHTHATIGGSDIKYSFVGNAARCLSACAAQTTSPNSNAGADAMASIIAHEMEEAHTDPDLNAWYDSRGYENADKCAWTFGTQSTAANGSKYNITLGGIQYLIQQNWLNVSPGSCKMAY